MCNFFSGVIDRNGMCYDLGEIVSHEEIIKKFNLKDGRIQFIARWEIMPRTKLNYLSPINHKNWRFVLDEEVKPSWWSKEFEEKCWKQVRTWFKLSAGKEFKRKFKKFKKLNKENEIKAKMSGEQLIHRTKLLKSHESKIIDFYLLGEKQPWDSVRDSVRDFVLGSVRYSVWDSVRDSVRDSVWDSVLDSVWYSVWDSVWNSKKPYPLQLGKELFDLSYLHFLIKEKDDITRIHVYGKKGVLLKKIDFKDKNEKILIPNAEKRTNALLKKHSYIKEFLESEKE